LEEEDYLILHIIEESDSTFDVSAALAINGYVASGRVKKSDVLGVYSRAYSGKLVIHETPQKGSKKRLISIKDNEFLTVLSCRSKWVEVFFSSAGKGYVGWLPPEMQCDNPYSTCN
ncbi:MAG TPA: hypothetical protein VFS25_00945, partial [Chitinophaga sp.]|uniref:hypothetical protein n=1 Tax=Chitinophaga sp. TaxID=1869181 RepID=UPI002DB71297